MTQALSLSQPVHANPQTLFAALSSGFALQEWFCSDARVAVQPGGRLYFWWSDGYAVTGTYAAVDAPQRLAFSWQGSAEPGVSQVTISLAAGAADVTTLTLTHETPDGAAWDAARERHAALWESALDNLRSIIEDGVDLRTARRAILGIVGGATLDKEAAAALGVPVDAGFRLTGVAPGTGAAAAGLQPDDVIVAIGADTVVDGATLLQATGRLAPGDSTRVAIYRGPQQLTLPLTMGGPLKATVPATPAAFAAAVESGYGALLEEIDALFDGTTEAQASAKPAPAEWSAKEVLAHLIYTERWAHEYLTLAVAQLPLGGFANDHGVHAAIAHTYGTVPALLQELRNSFHVSARAVGALPEELFARRRATLQNLANTFLLGQPFHARSHMDQIRAALRTAQESGVAAS